MSETLRRTIHNLLAGVRMPGQYIGGELHSIVRPTAQGRMCLAFPDTYALGMSCLGLQVLYSIINQRSDWACERAFTPQPDFESELRRTGLPLYGLETFTPLNEFDLLGFSLQYEVGYTNVLTMLDLGRIPLWSRDRGTDHPLVIAGGPGAQNPEMLAPFIDAFIIGDGEETLPVLFDRWLDLKYANLSRDDRIAATVRGLPWAYAPRFYEPEYHPDGTIAALRRTRQEVPAEIVAAVGAADFDDVPIPTRPIVPFVECTHDRIAIEIMRGCPWQCRFCQSTVIKRPLRFRSVEKIVAAALEAYLHTGQAEISLLSLSTSDYPQFPELVRRMHEVFHPLGVNVSVPSLRVNEQFRDLPKLIGGARKGGLTLAPEVARDDMRAQIRKPIDNDDLFEGCRQAFREGWRRVKLYFLCGLPGERQSDLDGIVDLAEAIARLGKETIGRYVEVTASVSNFVPKPHTPYQWSAMQTRDYFTWAHRHLRSRSRLRAVRIKCHDIDRSLLEGLLTRGDRCIAELLHEAWRRGARLDAWDEHFKPGLWWDSLRDLGIDASFYLHRPRPTHEFLPWDHINVRKGRDYLAKEHDRAVAQLQLLAQAP